MVDDIKRSDPTGDIDVSGFASAPPKSLPPAGRFEPNPAATALTRPPEGKPQSFTTSCATSSLSPSNAFPIRRRCYEPPSAVDRRRRLPMGARAIGIRINDFVYTAASPAASGARGLSATWRPDSMMGFRTAKSTIIPAVFDLAPNRQITANWQIRRHAPATEK
jgi:hypothetical protein